MNKIKVEQMKCFEQVAKVIGVSNARRELFIALNDCNYCNIETGSTICFAFRWDDTPQGYEFWRDISRRVSP